MTLPPQQPSAHPPVAPASRGAFAPTAQPGVPASTVASASASSNEAMRGDRFAAGARMGTPGEGAAPEPPFEQGVVADPAAVFSGPGYNFPPTPVNRPAHFALWLAVVGVIFPFALPASIGGAIWGLVYAQLNYKVGQRQAVAALVISVLSLVWWLFVWAAVMGMLPASL